MSLDSTLGLGHSVYFGYHELSRNDENTANLDDFRHPNVLRQLAITLLG